MQKRFGNNKIIEIGGNKLMDYLDLIEENNIVFRSEVYGR
jgi:hypothetical protein